MEVDHLREILGAELNLPEDVVAKISLAVNYRIMSVVESMIREHEVSCHLRGCPEKPEMGSGDWRTLQSN